MWITVAYLLKMKKKSVITEKHLEELFLYKMNKINQKLKLNKLLESLNETKQPTNQPTKKKK